jgi:hypothetical protein
MTVHVVDLKAHGNYILTANLGRQFINRHSTVLANICEISQPVGEELDYPFIGSARMTVCNIAPLDNGTVLVWLNIEWGSNLNVRVRLVVF